MSDAESAEQEEEETMKKLCKSNTNRKICGVCGGIAEYLNVDPTIVRLVWALMVFGWGVGVPLYIVCVIVLPEE